MCGIEGIISRNKINETQAEKALELFCNLENEGNDAAGLYNGEDIIKFPSTPSSMIALYWARLTNLDLFDKILDKRFVLFHNRAATHGNWMDNKNNHPFETESFVFSHNGVISDFYTHKKYKSEEPETDSWGFLKSLQENFNKNGDVIESLKIIIPDISGQITFWLYDKERDLIYFYNDNNRLFYVRMSGTFWFASLESYLKRTLSLKTSSIFPFKMNRLYEFSLVDFQLRNICNIPHSHSRIIYTNTYGLKNKRDTKSDISKTESLIPVSKKFENITLTPDLHAIMELHSLEISYATDEKIFIKFPPAYEQLVEDLHFVFQEEYDFKVNKNILILPKENWDAALLNMLTYLSEEC